MLIANPKATSTSRRARDLLARALSGDLDLEVAETAHRGHASELARRAADKGYDLVLTLGGDGTVNEAVNGLLAEGPSPGLPALAVLPSGSANVFARALGLPNDPIRAAQVVLRALRTGRRRTVGLATASSPDGPERYFTFNAGVGFDAEVVREVERRRVVGARADPSLYVRTGLRHFFRDTERAVPALTAQVPGRVPARGLFLALISNTAPWTYLGSRAMNPSPHADFGRGLDLFGMRSMGTLPITTALVRMALARSRPVGGRHALHMHDAPEIILRAERPVAFQLDGDYLGEHRLITFRSVPNAVRIVI
jgi:diacylglycerol kinase family enzyme